MPSNKTRNVQAIRVESESSMFGSKRIGRGRGPAHRFATTFPTRVQSNQDHRMLHEEADRVELRDHGERSKPCTYCGSIKHNDRGCWKRLTCQNCGRKGHPSDKCFFYACAACRKVHESGKSPSEKFYNLMRKWYVPTKHAQFVPSEAEEMLN